MDGEQDLFELRRDGVPSGIVNVVTGGDNLRRPSFHDLDGYTHVCTTRGARGLGGRNRGRRKTEDRGREVGVGGNQDDSMFLLMHSVVPVRV